MFLAIIVCKFIHKTMRLLGRGATSLPGKIALKICPDILASLSKNLKTIIVTGTNGKTTTARIIEQMLVDTNQSFFSNKSGANLLHGITTEYVINGNLTGKHKCDYALIECDEGAFAVLGKYVDARCVVVTNLFRDQLDRFGEITHTLNSIKTGIMDSHNAVLCLNGDCSMTTSLGRDLPNKVYYFGLEVPIYSQGVKESSDAPYCINCKTQYQYEYTTFGHLGKFKCHNCGYGRPKLDAAVKTIKICDENQSLVEIALDSWSKEASINLPGGYNIYNAIAAILVAKVMGWDKEIAVKSLNSFKSGFGRMEKFQIDNKTMRMILIKNPAGCNQVLNFISGVSEPLVFVICLSDNYADGTDVSWIWDVDFEILNQIKDKLDVIYISGKRCHDMAVRIKYTGLPIEKIQIIEDQEELLDKALAQNKQVYIMPTYTIMMELRKIISKKYGYKNFWE